jgi:hypothetical protein
MLSWVNALQPIKKLHIVREASILSVLAKRDSDIGHGELKKVAPPLPAPLTHHGCSIGQLQEVAGGVDNRHFHFCVTFKKGQKRRVWQRLRLQYSA